MGKTVSSVGRRDPASGEQPPPYAFSLYAQDDTAGGGRKYLNHEECRRVLAASATLERRPALFVLVLAWTGARVSEILALTPRAIQVERSLISIVTLKRRRWSVREVPIPPELMQSLAQEFSLLATQQDQEHCSDRLWPMHRVTAWRHVKRVMAGANVSGRAACPRGMRHAFGVGTLQAGVPITLVQRWLGHARLSTTAIYAGVSGPEELAMAKKFWDS
jgi:site-specific recombinase XerD